MSGIRAMLMIGPTGAGKSPLGDLIERKGFKGSRCFHFDFGSQLRWVSSASSPPEGFSLEEHAFVRGVIEDGLLLEDEHFHIAGKILERFVRMKGISGGDIIVMNGLPRHAGQARDADRLVDIERLIVLECTALAVYERISSNAGGDRAGRTDDDLGLIEKKLAIFKDRTAPLIDYYAKTIRNIHKVQVTATSTASDVYAEIVS